MTARKLFVNLPIESKQRSVEFFSALGFSFNDQFSDDTTACMVVSDEAYFMLLERKRFADFAPKTIGDPADSVSVLLALSCESRDEVDHLVHTALANGGKPSMDPQDHGFMYGWSFQDPDGHCWEVLWMDPAVASGEVAPS